jgi:tetratricopeptide (TPR) repeat protein
LNLKSTKAKILIAFNAICFFSGNFEKALEYINKGLEISEEINHKPIIALALNNLGGLLRQMGDLSAAMKAWERCLKITEDINFKFMKASVLDFLIPAAIEIGDVNKARSFLKILEEIDKEEKTKITHTLYLLNKAFVLKQSLRTHDRAESEDILKKLVKEQGIGLEVRITILLNLCDLLLKELQMTGYIEILDEIQHYIDILLDITEKRHGYLFLAEIYLLQARVSLITFNFKESKRYFTQAQQIAEQWKLTQISSKIAKEKEEFLRKIKDWEKHKKENIPLKERLELAQLDKQIELMLQNRTVIISRIVEEKVEVHKERKICMICKGGVSRYIYVCDCNAIYCESCVKALINLENACWVCESPIDQSKPVKHFGRDKVDVEKKNQFKKK